MARTSRAQVPPDLLRSRFIERVELGDDCWEWSGPRNRDGYGRMTVLGHVFSAHRTAYEVFVDLIPEGFDIDHLCRNRACVKPAHLEPVTRRENTHRGFGPTAVNARKTECIRGHELTPENTYQRRNGSRNCRPCGLQRLAELRERKTA